VVGKWPSSTSDSLHYDRSTSILTQFWHFFFTLPVRGNKSAQNEPLFVSERRLVVELYMR